MHASLLDWLCLSFQEGSEILKAAPEPLGSPLRQGPRRTVPLVALIATAGSIRLSFLVYGHEEKQGCPHDPELLGSVQWLCGPSRNNSGSSWYPVNTQKSSMRLLGGWEKGSQWIQGHCPSTINKVHHE